MEQQDASAVDDGWWWFRKGIMVVSLLASVVILVILVAIMFSQPASSSEGWQRVAPGVEQFITITEEITVRNTAAVGGPGEFEVNHEVKGPGEIELSFRSQPKERMTFELGFDFEKFAFQPKLKNAYLSIGENNRVSITTIEPTETPQTLQVTLTRK